MSLSVFKFDSAEVRTAVIDGQPWFVAADVCEAIAIGNVSMAVSRLDDDEKGVSSVDTLGGRQDAAVINESGLYSLILTSRKPEAKRFKKWVTSEVLPAIRKTGTYTAPATAELSRLDILKLAMESEEARIKAESERDHAIATKAHIGHQREATAMATASAATRKVERLAIELDESRKWASVKRMEMAYHGQKFDWRILKEVAAEMGIAPRKIFDANYGTVNAYHADVWAESYAVEII